LRYLPFLVLVATSAQATLAAESQCYGSVGRGRIEGSVNLPAAGPNFVAYSSAGAALGRTHVHTTVRDVVVSAYDQVARSMPGAQFVYGETGWPSGGKFRPHRTHQNGLSVDFFVPVIDSRGRSVALPTSPLKRFGYDIEFDANGQYGEYRIDFSALAEHLYQLRQAALAKQVDIALVIFDAQYLPRLFATARGSYLRTHMPFMKGKPWVRHDEHYHVDFAVPCRAMSSG